MALTTEQQQQLEYQTALEDLRAEKQIEVDTVRHNNAMALETSRAKADSVRIAKETLAENRRSQPAESRGITAEEIVAFSETLYAQMSS